ncbi:unnamed protein product [Meganyctiphanes norvegica]|uniref:Uncharacterized protein n=1 Tax=Meganyctiphanes norvegica TaxID=48144 RepID=A0AAV2QMX8_MEGNR
MAAGGHHHHIKWGHPWVVICQLMAICRPHPCGACHPHHQCMVIMAMPPVVMGMTTCTIWAMITCLLQGLWVCALGVPLWDQGADMMSMTKKSLNTPQGQKSGPLTENQLDMRCLISINASQRGKSRLIQVILPMWIWMIFHRVTDPEIGEVKLVLSIR